MKEDSQRPLLGHLIHIINSWQRNFGHLCLILVGRYNSLLFRETSDSDPCLHVLVIMVRTINQLINQSKCRQLQLQVSINQNKKNSVILNYTPLQAVVQQPIAGILYPTAKQICLYEYSASAHMTMMP